MAFDPDLRSLLKALKRITSPFPRPLPAKLEAEETESKDIERNEALAAKKR
jgi:hypothetical protein